MTDDMLTGFETTPGLAARLEELGIRKVFKAGEVILGDRAPIRSIPIVRRGSVRVIRTDEDGREILLYYIESGETCIMSFLGGLHNEKSKVRAEVEEEAEILFVPIQRVGDLIREYPEWLDYIFRLYHKRFGELLDIINEIAFRKVDERLLALLRKKARVSDSRVILATHAQLAGELGTARVVVSRLLKQLEERKMVKLGRNRILLKA